MQPARTRLKSNESLGAVCPLDDDDDDDVNVSSDGYDNGVRVAIC